jgi:hypothetical protein
MFYACVIAPFSFLHVYCLAVMEFFIVFFFPSFSPCTIFWDLLHLVWLAICGLYSVWRVRYGLGYIFYSMIYPFFFLKVFHEVPLVL